MVFKPQHYGLYFTAQHVQAAQAGRDHEPLAAAWKMLRERQQGGIESAQWCGLRYRFEDDQQAAKDGCDCLIDDCQNALDPDKTYIETVEHMLIAAHAFEMLRDLIDFTPDDQTSFLTVFAQRLTYLNQIEYERSYVETVWTALLDLVAGIVLEQEAPFQRGVDVYERVVREDIHPQGYILKAVEAQDGGGLLRQLLVVAALTLMAEAAGHVGVDLWGYSFRGVSVMTAFSYLMYYYFFPEKWRWDVNITNQPFSEYGGFLELINYRAYPKDLKPILDDLRPIYDPPSGGLTTLSHGVVRKRGGLLRH